MSYLQNIFSHFNLLLKDILQSILKKKINTYIITFSILFFSNEINCQDIFLKISSTLNKNNTVINRIKYQRKHLDSTSIYNELRKIENQIKYNGYYTVFINGIYTQKDTTYVKYNLGEKIEKVFLKINPADLELLKKINPKKNIIEIPITKLQFTLLEISKELDNKGFSFSETSLKNTKIKGRFLFADLHILKSTKRKINNIVIKGYERFPKSYLKHFIKINDKTIFTNKKLKDISKKLKSLSFIKQLKPLETLFKEDSTIIYFYLKKKKTNSFDGLINFNSNENGKIKFNGYFDLKLNNTFNRGEEISLNWNRFDNERQELNLSANTPFIYNLPISNNLEFSLYKQDSTFINTNFSTNLSVFINEKLQLALAYDLTTSKKIEKEIIMDNITDFSSQFIGVLLKYNIPMNDLFTNQKINLVINPKIGKRISNSNSSNQFKIDLFSSYIFNINDRNNIYLANKTGYINSDKFLLNELYRIGGAKSIRGFNQQSLFASKFSYFNLEYHFLTSTKSFIYTITDFGKFKDLDNSKNAYGIGLGYKFRTNSSLISFNYALGKINNQSFDYKNSKLIVSFITFF
jgi:hypothetical protein